MYNNSSEYVLDPTGAANLSLNNMGSDESERIKYLNFMCKLCAKFYINTLFAGPLCVLGLAGNTLSFLVLRKDKDSPVASFLLMSLAMIDNFFLTFWFLNFSLNDMLSCWKPFRYVHATWAYNFIRVYTYPLMFVGQTGMIWMTVLIAVSRYIAVCVPYKASQLISIPRMKLGVVLVTILSFTYNIPRYLELRVTADNKTGTLKYTFVGTALASNDIYRLVYFDIMYYIFTFVLPLLLLAVLNTQLVMSYRIIQKKRRALHVRSANSNQDNNITLVMIIVIVVFMVCNAPARIFQIVQKYKQDEMQCWSMSFVSGEMTSILEVLNSSANFIVYCLFRKKFWHQLSRVLCRCPCVKDNTPADPAKLPLNSSYKTNTQETTLETEI